MATSGMSKAWSPEDVFSPHGASILYGLHIGVVRFNVLVLDKDPDKFGRTSDRLPYLLLDLCLVKLFLVSPMAYGLGQSSYPQPLEKICPTP